MGHRRIEVSRRVFSFIDRMRSVGVGHDLERLIVLDQFVHQQFDPW